MTREASAGEDGDYFVKAIWGVPCSMHENNGSLRHD